MVRPLTVPLTTALFWTTIPLNVLEPDAVIELNELVPETVKFPEIVTLPLKVAPLTGA